MSEFVFKENKNNLKISFERIAFIFLFFLLFLFYFQLKLFI